MDIGPEKVIAARIAERMKARREELHLTHREVAARVNIERATYTRWENGEIAIKAANLKILADALLVDTTYFYKDDESSVTGGVRERHGQEGSDALDKRLSSIESQLQELLERLKRTDK